MQFPFFADHILPDVSAFTFLVDQISPEGSRVKMDANIKYNVILMQDSETFVRTVYAGNAIMTLKSLDPVKVQIPGKVLLKQTE